MGQHRRPPGCLADAVNEQIILIFILIGNEEIVINSLNFILL